MPGKFVLESSPGGTYHFNLLAGNGEVIATSETYQSKDAAQNGIAAVRETAPTAELDDRTASAETASAS